LNSPAVTVERFRRGKERKHLRARLSVETWRSILFGKLSRRHAAAGYR
jgi:hypothetical protein